MQEDSKVERGRAELHSIGSITILHSGNHFTDLVFFSTHPRIDQHCSLHQDHDLGLPPPRANTFKSH